MIKFLGIVAASICAVAAVGLATVHGSHAMPNPNACSSLSPCLSLTNGGKGEAIDGNANKNNGIRGVTHYASTSGTDFRAGILGLDLSASGVNDAGVEGQSTSGSGVMGVSLNGNGVTGTSQGAGVSGMSTGGMLGVYGQSSTVGVEGYSTSGSIAVLGVSSGGNGVGLEGAASGIGVQGNNTSSPTSIAFEAVGSGGTLFDAYNSTNSHIFTMLDSGTTYLAGDFYVNSIVATCLPPQCNGAPIFGATQNGSAIFGKTNDPNGVALDAEGGGGTIIDAVGSNGYVQAHIDNNGDIHTNGHIYTAGSCSVGCSSPTRPGTRIESYAAQVSQPTMEDFGEAQLANGGAYVRLDAAYANVIDRRANYLVFITPEGDCRQLYVTEKSGQGFAVREGSGGRSSVAFSYRIVAKPFGDASPRLPMTHVEFKTIPRPAIHMPHLPPVRRTLPKLKT